MFLRYCRHFIIWEVFICLFWVPQEQGTGLVLFHIPRRFEIYPIFRFQIHTSTASLVYLSLQIRIKCEILVSQSDSWIPENHQGILQLADLGISPRLHNSLCVEKVVESAFLVSTVGVSFRCKHFENHFIRGLNLCLL